MGRHTADACSTAGPDWLKPTEVARRISTGTKTIYGAIARGDLRCARPNGRDIRVHRSWVNDWLMQAGQPHN